MVNNTQNTKFKELSRGEIAIDEISVSGDNFRKQFNEDALKELADNIAKVGVLEPIILRQNRQYKILVAGERRLRAAQMAGLATIPYRLLDLTEEQAREVMVLENLHRADLNPIEEATAFKDLLESGGYTAEDVANRVDKSKAYVYRAIRLLDLPQEAQDALEKGEITTGHARHLLRIPHEEIKGLLKDIKRRQMTPNALKEQIRWQFGMDLERVGWKLDIEYAGKTACSKCPYNTANQQSLFDEALEAGKCTNKACYEEKRTQFETDVIEQVKEKAKKLGMGFFEPKYRYDYDDDFEELDEEMQAKYADEIKKHPAKFALTVPAGETEEVMFCIDEKLCKKINEEKYGSYEEPEEEPEDDSEESIARKRERDIAEKTSQMFAEKLMPDVLKKELTEEAFADDFINLREWQCKLLAKAFCIKDLTLKEILTLPSEKVILLLTLLTKVSEWEFENDLAEYIGHEVTDEEYEQIREQAATEVDKESK